METIEKSNTTFEPDKKATGVLSLGHLTVDTYSGFIAPIMPFIAAKLGMTVAIASLIISVSHLTSSILQPVFGYIADSMKKRFFVFWGLIFAATFISLTGVASNAWLLGAAIVLGSLGVGFYHPQASGLLAHFSGREISKFMGIFTACGTVGYAFGPVISSNMVQHFGLESLPFAVIPGIIVAGLLYKILPEIPKNQNDAKQKKFKTLLQTIFRNKVLVTLTLLSIIKALMVISYTVYMPFLWKEMGYSVAQIGFAIGSYSILGGTGAFLGGRLEESLGRKKIFLISLLPMMPLALGSLYLIKSHPLMSFTLFALIGFFTMFSVSVNIVMAQIHAPENKGMISGIIGGFSWGVVGTMLMPLGFFATSFGIVPVLSTIAIVPLFGSFLVKSLPDD